jgi:hypothetical protein
MQRLPLQVSQLLLLLHPRDGLQLHHGTHLPLLLLLLVKLLLLLLVMLLAAPGRHGTPRQRVCQHQRQPPLLLQLAALQLLVMLPLPCQLRHPAQLPPLLELPQLPQLVQLWLPSS